MSAAPEGWRRVTTPEGWLWAPEAEIEDLRVSGLERPWQLASDRAPGPGTGRDPSALVRGAGGRVFFVKQYLRGGVLAKLNRERYFSLGRFRRELEVGRRARAAGLPLGEVFAQVFRPAGPGWRAWGIARHVEGGVDLARRLETAEPREAEALWRAAMRTLRRMGESGLEHPDLNLGNLVATCEAAPAEGWLVHVVDLDRARFTCRALPLGARHAMLARLERSWARIFGAESRLPSRTRRAIASDVEAP